MVPNAIILMSDTGHDPTETAIPWSTLTTATTPIRVSFATENGTQPQCDPRMLTGWTGAVLGANAEAKTAYARLLNDPNFQKPLSWSDPKFTLKDFDAVILPGGHEKGVRQIIDNQRTHTLLAEYFPLTSRSSPHPKKMIAAICHGVQVLAFSSYPPNHPDTALAGKSLLHDVTTTALQGFHESFIHNATRWFLGDYYKTYGTGSPTVEEYVKQKGAIWKGSLSSNPFVVEDENHRYLSARFPADAWEFGERIVTMITED
jgi:putative intracellular protease/amidase